MAHHRVRDPAAARVLHTEQSFIHALAFHDRHSRVSGHMVAVVVGMCVEITVAVLVERQREPAFSLVVGGNWPLGSSVSGARVVVAIGLLDRQSHLPPAVDPRLPAVGVITRDLAPERPYHRIGAVACDDITCEPLHRLQVRVHDCIPPQAHGVDQPVVGDIGHPRIDNGLEEADINLLERLAIHPVGRAFREPVGHQVGLIDRISLPDTFVHHAAELAAPARFVRLAPTLRRELPVRIAEPEERRVVGMSNIESARPLPQEAVLIDRACPAFVDAPEFAGLTVKACVGAVIR